VNLIKIPKNTVIFQHQLALINLISSAPEKFQELIYKYFGHIKNVVYFDDILISATNKAEHDEILNEVIQQARKLNIKFNPKNYNYV